MNPPRIPALSSASTLFLGLAFFALPGTPAEAQMFGPSVGFPGYGYGYAYPGFPVYNGFGYPGYSFGYGYGYPGYGYGNPAYGYSYNNPGLGYGGVPMTSVPQAVVPAYGYLNPMLGMGLTPLGVQSALGEGSLQGRPSITLPGSGVIPKPNTTNNRPTTLTVPVQPR